MAATVRKAAKDDAATVAKFAVALTLRETVFAQTMLEMMLEIEN